MMHKAFTVSVALFLVLAAASAGQALCIYNHTDDYVSASNPPWIDQWYIQKHTHRCTDGDHGGDWHIKMVKNDFLHTCLSPKYKIYIDTEGWLSIYPKEGSTWKAVSRSPKGEVKHVKYLKYDPHHCGTD